MCVGSKIDKFRIKFLLLFVTEHVPLCFRTVKPYLGREVPVGRFAVAINIGSSVVQGSRCFIQIRIDSIVSSHRYEVCSDTRLLRVCNASHKVLSPVKNE